MNFGLICGTALFAVPYLFIMELTSFEIVSLSVEWQVVMLLAVVITGIFAKRVKNKIGKWLSFQLHKLGALGFVVWLVWGVVSEKQVLSVSLILVFLSLFVLFFSGAMISLKQRVKQMLLIHRLFTVLFVLFFLLYYSIV